MANQNSAKGNPASKRMSNPAKKALRQACWARGEKRKKLRVAKQEKQAAHNRALRADGEPTPWETAKAVRAARRAADPAIQARARALKLG